MKLNALINNPKKNNLKFFKKGCKLIKFKNKKLQSKKRTIFSKILKNLRILNIF